MRVKFWSGLVLAAVLVAIIAMAGLVEAKEISITKIRPDKEGATKSTPPLGIYLSLLSSTFQVREFEFGAMIYNVDSYAGTTAVITIYPNNSIAYIYECVYDPNGVICEDYPFGYATPNAPLTFYRYLNPAGPGGATRFKVLVESYGDLNHPYYGVNVTACHYTQPENCASRYVQGKYSGYEIG